MYLRFVLNEIDEESCRRVGVFQGSSRVQRDFAMSSELNAQIEDLFGWFNVNLVVPRRFSRSRRPLAAGRAICWFRDSADAHIDKIRELVCALEEGGAAVSMIWETKLGYITYEDEYQVVAVPFRDTAC